MVCARRVTAGPEHVKPSICVKRRTISEMVRFQSAGAIDALEINDLELNKISLQ